MKRSSPRRVVIVDGYSTGRDLVAELLERNVECYHLQSSECLPQAVAECFDVRPYDANLGYLGEPDAAARVLSTIAPDAVIAGSEWGVLFADEVARRMGMPSNRPDTARARRDKFEMIETVSRAGLRTADQAVFTCAEEAVAWTQVRARWPVVVKPLNSAGSDGVSICHGPDDIRRGFAKALNRCNFMGDNNDRLLLQSFLEGHQYVVNTLSHHGRHRVTDAWYMPIRTLPGSAIIADELHLLDAGEQRARALIDYTLAMLDALGIENGAAHTELKWTEAGPALIEVGARLMGAAMDSESYVAARLQSQASAWADLLASDDCSARTLIEQGHFAKTKSLSKVFFSFPKAGMVLGVTGLERLRKLQSFHAHYRPLKIGDRVWKTEDTLACGGVVYLIHDDQTMLQRDLELLRAWERLGALYCIQPDETQKVPS